MVFRLTSLIIFAAMVHSGDAMAQRKIDSMYTDIAGPACKKAVNEKISGASIAVCPGVAGFHIHVLEDDERSSISVIAPNGHVFPLEYWEVVTHGFSILESRAEWRVTRKNGKVDALLQDAHHQARTIADDADRDCLQQNVKAR